MPAISSQSPSPVSCSSLTLPRRVKLALSSSGNGSFFLDYQGASQTLQNLDRDLWWQITRCLWTANRCRRSRCKSRLAIYWSHGLSRDLLSYATHRWTVRSSVVRGVHSQHRVVYPSHREQFPYLHTHTHTRTRTRTHPLLLLHQKQDLFIIYNNFFYSCRLSLCFNVWRPQQWW